MPDGLEPLFGGEDFEDAPGPDPDPARGKFKVVEDKSHTLAPTGCVLRKFEATGQAAYWFGRLRRGVRDTNGKCTRQRTWMRTGITEADLKWNVHDWLWGNCPD